MSQLVLDPLFLFHKLDFPEFESFLPQLATQHSSACETLIPCTSTFSVTEWKSLWFNLCHGGNKNYLKKKKKNKARGGGI